MSASMNRRYWYIIGSLATVGLVVVAVLYFGPKPPIPGPIRRQLTSTLLVPTLDQVKVDRDSVQYDPKQKLLSYTATAFEKEIVLSEQPTPESFLDIPQVYEKLVTSMGEYSKFEVEVGTVHLTRPKDLGGKQAAVLNSKGTLMFVKPARDLSNDEWRLLFRSLAVVH